MLTAIMKNRLLLLFLFSANLYGNDTMMVDNSFTSPITNPVAIEFFENSFWIANLTQSKIYKLNSSMILIDSIEVGHNRISGIAYKGQKLWIAVDRPVNDVAIPSNYLPYRIYGIDLISKTITDSIFFKLGSIPNDTGIVLGISTLNDTLCITLNMGWSSGIYSIIPEETPVLKNYLPLSGMTLIGNELWGIRRSFNDRIGCCITTISRADSLSIPIEVTGSDLAYDGTNVFICIPEESQITKLKAAELAVKNTQTSKKGCRHLDTYNLIDIGNHFARQSGTQYISLHGRKMNGLKKNNAIIGSQVFIGVDTERKTMERAQ